MLPMKRKTSPLTMFFALSLAGFLPVLAGGRGESASKPPKVPATWTLDAPAAAGPGDTVELSLTLQPKSGIKVNRYPQIAWSITSDDNPVAGDVKSKLGSDGALPFDAPDADRYFKSIDPIVMNVRLDPQAAPGDHKLKTRLKYFYCVTKSGFCAPAKVSVEVPIRIE